MKLRPGERPTHPARRLPAAAAVLAAALVAGGCGIFDPADPEQPGGGQVQILPNLTEQPDSALYSLQLGLVTKQIAYYQHAIAETTVVSDADFHAVFDPQDAADYQLGTGTLPPADWTSSDERTFFTYFASKQPVEYTVAFYPDESRQDERGAQLSKLYRHYRIYAGPAPLAVGLADLWFRRVGVNQEWKLVYWEDRRDSTAGRTYGRERLDSLSR